MAFRRDPRNPDTSALRLDPFDRFAELYTALNSQRRWWQDHNPRRLAAIVLVSCEGEVADLVSTVIATDAAMAARMPWHSGITSSVRMLFAAQLVRNGGDPAAFLEQIQALRGLFREAGIRRYEPYEALAALILLRRPQAPPGPAEVARLKAIYDAMKDHHWWLTGPEDLAACALLVAQPGSAKAIADGVERIYQALHRDGCWRGDPLQTAANLLYLSGLEAAEVAQRFGLLVREFRAAGARIGQSEYDEIAVLCFVAQPVDRIVSTVLELRERLRQLLRWTTKGAAFNLAVNLAFVSLAASDEELANLADVKLVLDMQAIVAAQQAAAS